MPHKIIDFREAANKIVETITLTNEPDYRAITLHFTDRTVLDFQFHLRMDVLPAITDWKTGRERVVRTYEVIKEPSNGAERK